MYLIVTVLILLCGLVFLIRPAILCGTGKHKVGMLELSAAAVRLTGGIFLAAGLIMLAGLLSGKITLPLF